MCSNNRKDEDKYCNHIMRYFDQDNPCRKPPLLGKAISPTLAQYDRREAAIQEMQMRYRQTGDPRELIEHGYQNNFSENPNSILNLVEQHRSEHH